MIPKMVGAGEYENTKFKTRGRWKNDFNQSSKVDLGEPRRAHDPTAVSIHSIVFPAGCGKTNRIRVLPTHNKHCKNEELILLATTTFT